MESERSPLVSIITAAYNRSNVLKYAIASVLRSTVEDWELLVVNDASTDNTEAVVKSFVDRRIRYLEMPKNTGNQAEPNNEAFRHARGRYIAYLSQDDLWFPDHLEESLRVLREPAVDWVFNLGIALNPANETFLLGVMPEGRFDPRYGKEVPATLWVLKREVLEEIGSWPDYRSIRIPPSTDLMLRAWKAGKNLVMVPAVTAVLVQSGLRLNSYAERQEEENKLYDERMCNEPDFRTNELLRLSISREKELVSNKINLCWACIQLLKTAAKRLGFLIGFSAIHTIYLLRHWRKGGVIASLRKIRGLPPAP